MKIREAEEKDTAAIVAVLKASLGETNLPLSEEIWRYKHVDNPFGKSIVLVAEEKEQIIGVRAFMRWKWCKRKEEFSALRAVDTATHPKNQGRGIFKNLTLKAVEIAQKKGDHFVFNTPNEQSRPGYLKMGWNPVGKVKVGLKPSFYGLLKFPGKIDYEIHKDSSAEVLHRLCQNWNSVLESKGNLYTPKSPEMLSWRYENNPLQDYEVIFCQQFYLAAYVKKRKGIKELRIAECIYDINKPEEQKEVKKAVWHLERKFGAQFVSFSPDIFQTKALKISGNYGPILTLRNLNLIEEKEESALQIKSWNNSLGDLELF